MQSQRNYDYIKRQPKGDRSKNRFFVHIPLSYAEQMIFISIDWLKCCEPK